LPRIEKLTVPEEAHLNDRNAKTKEELRTYDQWSPNGNIECSN